MEGAARSGPGWLAGLGTMPAAQGAADDGRVDGLGEGESRTVAPAAWPARMRWLRAMMAGVVGMGGSW